MKRNIDNSKKKQQKTDKNFKSQIESDKLLVVDREYADEWYVKLQNQYLVRGFRKNYNSFTKCLKSLFHVHNELLNIWTHIIGCIMSIGILIFIYQTITKISGIEHIIQQDFQNYFNHALENIDQQYFQNQVCSINSDICLSNEFIYQDLIQQSTVNEIHITQHVVSEFYQYQIKEEHAKDDHQNHLSFIQSHIIDNILDEVYSYLPFYEETQRINIPIRKNNENIKYKIQEVGKWPIILFQAAALFTFFGSSCFHTFNSINKKYYMKLIRLDYTGIASVLSTGCSSIFYYSYFCDEIYFYFYITTTMVLGTVILIVSLCDFIHTYAYHKIRTAMYGSFALLLTIPTFQAFYRSSQIQENMLTDDLALGVSVYYYIGVIVAGFGGIAIYVLRIPERWNIGKFDIIGSSHQLWHLCCLVIIVCGHMGIYTNYYERKQHFCLDQ